MTWQTWPGAVALAAALLAAVSDYRTGRIPNLLTLPLLVAAQLTHLILAGPAALLHSTVGVLVCGMPGYFLFHRGAVGGGDVKLFAALGALLGAGTGLEVQLVAFMIVAGYALLRTAWCGRAWALLRASTTASLHLVWPARFEAPAPHHAGHVEVRMGPAILVATCAVCLGVTS